MPWLELPFTIERQHDGTVPLTVNGGPTGLQSIDESVSDVLIPMIPGDGSNYDTAVGWVTGTFDGSILPAGVVVDRACIRFQNQGSGVLSYPWYGVYSGALLSDANGDPADRLADLLTQQAERTSLLWVTSELEEDNEAAIRYDIELTVGKTSGYTITTDKLIAGQVRGIVYNDFGASSSQRLSYFTLRVHFLYVGPWIQAPDFAAYQASTAFPDAWQPTKSVPIDREWTQLHNPSFPSTSTADADARAKGWEHIVVGQAGTEFWNPGSPAAVVDNTESSYLDNSTISNDGQKARARYAYDYDPPVVTIGDTTDWDRRDIVFLQRPDDALWLQAPDVDVPAEAADVESESDYADVGDPYGVFRFFNYLTRVDWKLDQTFRSPLDDGEPSTTGQIEGWVFPKLWDHDANSLGPFTGTGNESLNGGFFPYHHTDVGSPGSVVGDAFQVTKDGIPVLDGDPKLYVVAEDVGAVPGWRYPYTTYPASGSNIEDAYEPKWHATFVYVSNRQVEPSTMAGDDQEDALVPTGSWAEATANIRMVVKWSMRPPRHRFLYEAPPYEPHPLRQRQIGWLSQRQRHRRPGIARQSRW